MCQKILQEHLNTQKEYDDIVNINSYHHYSFTCQCSNPNKVGINKAFDRHSSCIKRTKTLNVIYVIYSDQLIVNT